MKRLPLLLLSLLLLTVTLNPVSTVSAAASASMYGRVLIGVLNRNATLRVTWASSAKALGQLQKGDRVIATGRNQAGSWLVVDSQYGYGYVPTTSLDLKGDLRRLAVVPGNVPNVVLPDDSPTDDPATYPVLPVVSAFTQQIYERGWRMGNRSEVFTKVGDCMTADALMFLGEIGDDHYDLGAYASLQGVIDYYSRVSPRKGAKNSFVAPSAASFTGFNVSSVEDPEWLPPGICPEGVTPLACEYEAVKPGIAIIMFGTNDMTTLTPAQYDFYLRMVVIDTIDHGVIPLLSTFPGDPWQPKKANRLNQIVFQIAHDFDIPVMNLWLAIQPLPNTGLRPGSNYLSWVTGIQVAHFQDKPLQYGYTMRNLITLLSLDILWKQVIQLHSF